MQNDVQKRRAARQKKARRRQLKILLIFFLIIALITLIIMCFTVFFHVKRISVSGSKKYTNSQIIKASGISTDDNLFVISENEIEENIRKKLPYVEDVKLERNLPDAVILTITDAKEFACYKTDREYCIVSEKEYVLKKSKEHPENVFVITTSGVSAELSEIVVYENSAEKNVVDELISLLQKHSINIDEIDVTNLIDIKINVEDKFVVELGTNENLSEKIAHLSGMIESIGNQSGKIILSMWTPANRQGTFVEDTN